MSAADMTRPLTALIGLVFCGAICFANADIEPGSMNGFLSESEVEQNFKSRNRQELLDLLRQVLEEEYRDDVENTSKDYSKLRSLYQKLLYILSTDANKELLNKRACRVNLGGHCATENAVAMADQWAFLKSKLSPGRRRRRSTDYSSSSSSSLLQPESVFHGQWQRRKDGALFSFEGQQRNP